MMLISTQGIAVDKIPEPLADQRNQKHFIAPTYHELTSLESLFSDLLQPNSRDHTLTSRAESLGFTVSRDDQQNIHLVDRESRGWGYYRFATLSAGGLVIQAPHQFYDRHTGTIARAIFEQVHGKILALNSSHRYTDRREDTPPSDLAHIPNSPFNSLTRAVALGLGKVTIIQLHGYSAEKRKSAVARASDIIISSGASAPQPEMLRIADCLSQQTPWRVLRFPEDTGELGGTRNLQGQLLHALGKPIFVHMELSHSVRKALINNPETMTRFTACITPQD
ncbi:hypothetical protein [Marinobacter caseinilyticus]|uniref:hypothetical protein n=1 Tax=Marinobacter caseinilyticus TaxID=2692195 RepID=UPI00140B89CC|nr:hypothetical protein [Marinobacter caseinilyticus]